jgi:hypothetical protein
MISRIEEYLRIYLDTAINSAVSTALGQAVSIPVYRAYPPGWVFNSGEDVVISVTCPSPVITRTPGRWLNPTTYLAGYVEGEVEVEVMASTPALRDDISAVLSQVLDIPGSDRFFIRGSSPLDVRYEYQGINKPGDQVAWLTAAYREIHTLRARSQYILTTPARPLQSEANVDLRFAPFEVLEVDFNSLLETSPNTVLEV